MTAIATPVSGMSSGRSGGDHRGWRRADGVAAGIIGAQVALLLAMSVPGSFYQDDFRAMSNAARGPWTVEWIFGIDSERHFSPLVRAWYSALVEVAPMQHGPAVAAVLVLQVAVMVTTWLLLRRLLGAGPAALAGLAVLAMTPLTVPVVAWQVQAVQLLPVQLGAVLAAHGLLGWSRHRRPGWLVLLAGGLLLALATWEQGLLVGPLLVVLAAAIPMIDSPGLARRLWALWPAWAVVTVLSAGYLALWLSGSYGTGQPAPGPGELAVATGQMLVGLLLPGLWGGPWAWRYELDTTFAPVADTPGWGIALALLASVAVVAAGVRRSPAATWRGAALVVLAPVLVFLPAAWARLGGAFGDAVPDEPRYVAAALPFVAVGIGVLAGALLPRTRPTSPARRAGLAAIILLVLAGALASDVRFAARWWQNPAGDWVAAARTGWSSAPQGVATFDGFVPDAVLPRLLFGPYARVSELLRPAGVTDRLDFGADGAATITDERGRLVPAGLRELRQLGEDGCRPLRGPDAELRLPVGPTLAYERDLSIRLRVVTQRPVTLSVVEETPEGDVRLDVAGDADPRVEPGLGADGVTLTLLLEPDADVSAVRVRAEEFDSGACLAEATLGVPAPFPGEAS